MTDATATLTVRLLMPDRWLEHVTELAPDTTVAEAKVLGMRAMLQRPSDDPDDYYVEFLEREIPDESRTLEDLGVEPGSVLNIRRYDLGHYRRFRG